MSVVGPAVLQHEAAEHWEALLRRGHERLAGRHGVNYGWDDALVAYKESAMYYLSGAMSLIATFDAGNERGAALVEAYSTRILNHCVDIDAGNVLWRSGFSRTSRSRTGSSAEQAHRLAAVPIMGGPPHHLVETTQRTAVLVNLHEVAEIGRSIVKGEAGRPRGRSHGAPPAHVDEFCGSLGERINQERLVMQAAAGQMRWIVNHHELDH